MSVWTAPGLLQDFDLFRFKHAKRNQLHQVEFLHPSDPCLLDMVWCEYVSTFGDNETNDGLINNNLQSMMERDDDCCSTMTSTKFPIESN